MIPAFMNWSGGKDCSLAFYHILQQKEYDIQALLTSVNSAHKRISMHGVREELLDAQAEQLNIRLEKLQLPEMPSMRKYNHAMNNAIQLFLFEGMKASVFGDIFLEDLREYRDSKLRKVGMQGVYPLWKRDTTELLKEFLSLGFKAKVACVKADLLDESFAGRELDGSFLNDLPGNVDPCGENGEFHTFVYEGPIFPEAIPVEVGETIYRTYEAPKTEENPNPAHVGFWFTDLTLKK